MSDVDDLKQDITFSVTMRGQALTFHSTWGMFSPRRIDDGTWMLVEKLQLAPADVTLDLGCGYGAIGVVVGKCCPQGRVHMVDKDFLAVEFARKNAAINGVPNAEAYLSNAFSHVPDGLVFDNVVSNIPANVGKEMLSIILHDARDRLRPGGRIWVVTVAGLRQYIKRNFNDVFGNYEKVKQGKTYAVATAEWAG